MTNKTFLTIILTLSFCATFGTGQAMADFGDCLSWIWGGNNESTTYSPPYTPPVASIPNSNPNGGQAASPAILGQSTGSATPGYGASPSYTGARSDEYSPSSSNTTLKPFQPAQPTTELRPVVKREWTYSPITSVAYKPVQQIDPQTGQVSTYYRAEESKTLFPWLHRKETIEYKPVLMPSNPLVPQASAPPTTPPSSPQIVQANYAASQPSQTYVAPVTQTPWCYDPCGNLVYLGTLGSESIPVQTTGGYGDLTLSQSPNASSTASTYVSRNTGVNINYGTPPVREGYGATPASAADQVPVVDRRAQRPLLAPLVSEADLRPVHPFSEATTETVEKPETTTRSSNLIRTPVPDLPLLQSAKKESTGQQKLVSPTQVYRKYQH